MAITTTTHLNFRGQARAALAFYHSVFGGTPQLVTYRDLGAVSDPTEADQVIWGEVRADNGFAIMAYDVPGNRPWHPGEAPFFVSVRGTDPEEVTRYWTALATQATILAPLATSAWAPLYGMLKDQFGITWVLDVAAPR